MHLALFDFDGTLTTRDTLLPFVRFVVGGRRFAGGMLALSPVLAAYAAGLLRNDAAKERLLAHFLAGMPLQRIESAGEAFAHQRLDRGLRGATMQALAAHRARGDTCVLVSASLEAYVRPWGLRHGFDAVLASRLEQAVHGVTGRLLGGNCHGAGKVARIRGWLQGRQPVFIDAYGNSRGDREMLAMADAAHWVR